MRISGVPLIFTMGHRPPQDRPWIKRVGALVLLAAALATTPAHAHEVSSSSSPVVSSSRDLAAPVTHPARLVDNRLLIRAAAGQLSWASSSGAIDGPALIAQWERQGLRPDQGMELLSLLVFTQSPTLARTAQAESLAHQSSKATQSIMEIATATQADIFLSRRTVSKLIRQGEAPPSLEWNRPEAENATWSGVHQYWQQLGVQTGGTPEQSPASSPQDVDRAMKALAAATDEAGLAAFQIPLPAMGRADLLNAMARKVQEANHALAQLTGLSGPVLGLNGRASFIPFTPTDNAFAYQLSPGVLRMESRWEDVPHEWIHMLDFSLRSTASASEFGGASLSHQVWKGRVNYSMPSDVLSRRWSDLYNHLDPDTTQPSSTMIADWRARRATHTSYNQDLALYLEAPTEIVGYAWGSYVQSRQSEGSVFFDPRQQDRLAYVFGPTVEQASTLSSQWQEAFKAVNSAWWSTQVFAPESRPARNLAQAAAQWNAAASSALSTPYILRR